MIASIGVMFIWSIKYCNSYYVPSCFIFHSSQKSHVHSSNLALVTVSYVIRCCRWGPHFLLVFLFFFLTVPFLSIIISMNLNQLSLCSYFYIFLYIFLFKILSGIFLYFSVLFFPIFILLHNFLYFAMGPCSRSLLWILWILQYKFSSWLSFFKRIYDFSIPLRPRVFQTSLLLTPSNDFFKLVKHICIYLLFLLVFHLNILI